jgi:hypothetical protein
MQRAREGPPKVSSMVSQAPVSGRADSSIADEEAPAVWLLDGDDDFGLFLRAHDVVDPEVSIVQPAVNGEPTLSSSVEWCQEGLAAAHVLSLYRMLPVVNG